MQADTAQSLVQNEIYGNGNTVMTATIFGIEEVIEQFSLQKVTFRTYMGLLLLPVTFMLFYSDYITNFIIYSIIIILLTINLLAYFISLKIYQNLKN